jgi:hypothetical protein
VPRDQTNSWSKFSWPPAGTPSDPLGCAWADFWGGDCAIENRMANNVLANIGQLELQFFLDSLIPPINAFAGSDCGTSGNGPCYPFSYYVGNGCWASVSYYTVDDIGGQYDMPALSLSCAGSQGSGGRVAGGGAGGGRAGGSPPTDEQKIDGPCGSWSDVQQLYGLLGKKYPEQIPLARRWHRRSRWGVCNLAERSQSHWSWGRMGCLWCIYARRSAIRIYMWILRGWNAY